MSRAWPVGAFLLIFGALPMRVSAEPPYALDDARHFFEDVAIGTKPGARLVKWRSAPSVRLETVVRGPEKPGTDQPTLVAGETPERLYAALEMQVRALAELTGLPMRLMPRDIGEGGDIVISIVPRNLMSALPYPDVPAHLLQELMGPSRCYFIVWPDSQWGIRKARIAINARLEEDHIKHCFIEELTQAMGLPNDSERLGPSIFNETSKRTSLSVLDEAFIRTLYDPRLRPGIDFNAVRQTVGDVLRVYLPRE